MVSVSWEQPCSSRCRDSAWLICHALANKAANWNRAANLNTLRTRKLCATPSRLRNVTRTVVEDSAPQTAEEFWKSGPSGPRGAPEMRPGFSPSALLGLFFSLAEL